MSSFQNNINFAENVFMRSTFIVRSNPKFHILEYCIIEFNQNFNH